MWDESAPIAGTPAERYLRARGIARALAPEALRCHPRATALDDRYRRPALIAALRDRKGQVQGVELTLLTRDGSRKAPLPTPRRIVGRLAGGAVALDPADDTLLVAEGVATALSASQALALPVWALLGAHNLARFSPPATIRRLVVAADRDRMGMSAALKLCARLAPKIEVDVAPPPAPFKDWNDWACAGVRIRSALRP